MNSENNNLKLINYASHNFDKKEITEVNKVLQNEPISRSGKIEEFEIKLKEFFGSKFAITCSNGTTALEICLKAIGLKLGDEVIVPCISWSSTATSISRAGGVPVFVDIDNDFPNISIKNIEKAITKKTKAIIPVHFAGNSVNIKYLRYLLKNKNIKIIEDSCHAIGGKYEDGKFIGNSTYGDFCCFSFHPAKNITTGEGGAITTNNKAYYQKILNIRNNGIIRPKNINNKSNYDCIELSSNFHLSSINAAIGIVQLKKLERFINYRKKIYNYYIKKFQNFRNIKIVKHSSYSAFNLMIVLTNKKNQFIKKMIKNGINVFFHYPLIPSLSIYKNKKIKSRISGKLDNGEEYVSKAVSLPLHTNLSLRDIDFIYKKIIDNNLD